jgi:hypothetical protein
MNTQIFATGKTLTTGAASVNTTLPATLNGTPAKWVRVASTSAAYVKLGAVGVAAVAGDVMVQPGDSIKLAVSGATTIAALQVSAAGTVQISPCEES